MVFSLLQAAGYLPEFVHPAMVAIFGTKATAVFTNVPGPKQTLYFAGQALTDLYFWVPQAGHLGLGVSILSYNGGVRMGVGTDAGLIPDPERIVDGFHAEFERSAGPPPAASRRTAAASVDFQFSGRLRKARQKAAGKERNCQHTLVACQPRRRRNPARIPRSMDSRAPGSSFLYRSFSLSA